MASNGGKLIKNGPPPYPYYTASNGRKLIKTGPHLIHTTMGYTPLGRYSPIQPPTPGRHPPGQTTPLSQTPPLPNGHCSGRYASYWNAFLYSHVFAVSFNIDVMILVNMKLDVSWHKKITYQGSETSFVKFISNGIAETKLEILAFLCCGEFVKNSI